MESKILEIFRNLNYSNEWFIGKTVQYAIESSNNMATWSDAVERYAQLQSSKSKRFQFYVDLTTTILVKKFITTDLNYMVAIIPNSPIMNNKKYMSDRTSYLIISKLFLVRFLTCVHESVYSEIPPRRIIISEHVSDLYRTLYGICDKYFKVVENRYVEVEPVMPALLTIVGNWLVNFLIQTAPSSATMQFKSPADLYKRNLVFTEYSHCIWLWLHLTAPRVANSVNELFECVYTLDLLIFCTECNVNFTRHRLALFTTTKGDFTMVHPRITTPVELIYLLHNIVNMQVYGKQIPREILHDYNAYWTIAGLEDVNG